MHITEMNYVTFNSQSESQKSSMLSSREEEWWTQKGKGGHKFNTRIVVTDSGQFFH